MGVCVGGGGEEGEIQVHNKAPWAQLEEVEWVIPSLVLTQYTDERARIEANDPRSSKSERSLGGIEQVTWTKRQNTEEGGTNV